MPRRRGRGSWAEKLVAKLYRKAGYNVIRNKHTPVGEVDIIAWRGREKLVVEVKSGKQRITSRTIEKLVRKAKYLRGKPVIIHGPRVGSTGKARLESRKHRVRVRKYRKNRK